MSRLPALVSDGLSGLTVARLRAVLASAAARDLMLIVPLALLASVGAVLLDINDRLVDFTHEVPALEAIGLDDLPLGFAVLSLAMAWYARRRWREYRAESEAHERTLAQLRLAMSEVVAANQAKAQFLAAMSHELRTPLNAILGFSEIIKDQSLGPILPKYADYAGDIHSSGTLLLSIVSDILDMARSDAGTLHFRPEPVDVADTLERVRRLIAGKAAESGLRIEMASDPRLVAWVDPAKFRQAILNLAFNAVKFTPSEGRILIRASRDGDFARVEIIDNGIGMAKDDIPRALMPFQQIDNSRQRRFEGTGLGLPLAKRFIEQQGGTLELESEPGLGTTAIARIPLAHTRLEAAD